MIFKPTDEQNEIINLGHHPGKLISVRAYAGTGKTTTLIEAAKRMPGPILYLVFNKAAQKDAERRFPDQVEVRTVHSLCWRDFGSKYREKLADKKNPFSTAHCLGVLNRDGVRRDRIEKWMLSSVARRAVNEYTFSDSSDLTMEHVPSLWGIRHLNSNQKDRALDLARKTWTVMRDVRDTSVPMTFDGYLKLYQLSGKRPRHRIVFLDECQDSNAVTLSVLRNSAAGKSMAVMIGDPHQQIYAFRGSRNAFGQVNHDLELRLTESFRFGQRIADRASYILHKYKAETVPLTGLANPDMSAEPKNSAVLCRSNAQVIVKALDMAANGRTFRIAGGPPGHIFSDCFDVLKLDSGKKGIDNPLIAMFNSSEDLIEYAQASGERVLESLVKFARQHSSKLATMKKTVEDFHSEKSNNVLSTAHKAKGLEWDDVTLSEDFALSFNDYDVLPKDEANLLYVACTRAKRVLNVPKEIDTKIQTGSPEPEPEDIEQ